MCMFTDCNGFMGSRKNPGCLAPPAMTEKITTSNTGLLGLPFLLLAPFAAQQMERTCKGPGIPTTTTTERALLLPKLNSYHAAFMAEQCTGKSGNLSIGRSGGKIFMYITTIRHYPSSRHAHLLGNHCHCPMCASLPPVSPFS